MAEIDKTLNYGLTIFDDAQTSLTFKEWRNYMAGIGADEATYSNMQKIDALFKKYEKAIDDCLNSSKNYAEELIERLKKENEEVIKDDGDKIVIGGENGKPIDINDGSQTSHIENGVLTINGVEVSFVRIRDYVLRYNDNNKHLQLSYKPKSEGVI